MKRFFAFTLTGILLLLVSLPLAAQGQNPDPEELIEWNFDRGTTLELFLTSVSNLTRTRFIYNRQLQGEQIFLKNPVMIRVENVMKLTEVVLQYNGITMIPIGREEENKEDGWQVYMIFRDSQAKWGPSRFVNIEDLPGIDHNSLISVVMPMRYIEAKEVQQAFKLARITHPNVSAVVAVRGSGGLLVTDYAINVKRIWKVLQLMDVAGPQLQFHVIRLQWTDPEELTSKLEKLLAATGVKSPQQIAAGGTPDRNTVQIVSFPRINSIAVQSYEDRYAEVLKLVRELDIEPKEEIGGIHIHKLKHADATKLEEILNKLLQGRPIVKQAGPPKAGSNASAGTDKPATVVADTEQNALIVTAHKEEWLQIRRIIEELDQRRAQVLIEAAIVEISPQDTFNLGIEYATIDGSASKSSRPFAASSFGLSSLVDSNGNPITASSPGIPVGRLAVAQNGMQTGFTRGSIFKIPILLQMLKQEANLRVVSVPRILANDNQSALIEVKESVPVTEFQTTAAGSDQTSFQDFEDAGIELKITPHISADNYLRLDIEQTIEVFTASQITSTVPPPKTSRKLVTSITIPNKQTVTIGGLVSTSERTIVSKVPFFGDLPWIGQLFRNTTQTVTKSNIYIFLTPHILNEKDFRDLHKISWNSKVEAADLEAEVELVDPEFMKYRKRNELLRYRGRLESQYKLQYRSPSQRK